MNTKIDCLQCSQPHPEGESTNGYCVECTDAFIRREGGREALAAVQDHEQRGVFVSKYRTSRN